MLSGCCPELRHCWLVLEFHLGSLPSVEKTVEAESLGLRELVLAFDLLLVSLSAGIAVVVGSS